MRGPERPWHHVARMGRLARALQTTSLDCKAQHHPTELAVSLVQRVNPGQLGREANPVHQDRQVPSAPSDPEVRVALWGQQEHRGRPGRKAPKGVLVREVRGAMTVRQERRANRNFPDLIETLVRRAVYCA
jgi:hypothetical protein